MASITTKWVTQMIIVIVIVMIIIGVLFTYFAQAKQSAADVRKVAELTQLYKVIESYYIGEGHAPENPTGKDYCEIDKLYGHKRCLRELGRDGYTGALPISFDNEPYYYYDDEDVFFVTTRLSKELDVDKQCPYESDKHMWCKVFEK